MDGTPVPNSMSVAVAVPARLHLGFLDLNGGLGRRFGSLGLAVSGLGTRITLRRAADMRVTGPESERGGRYLEMMLRRLSRHQPRHLHIDEIVPAHAGLGSGTQLALAVATAVRHLHGLPFDPEGDAAALGRGARSGVGIGLFHRGGLIVDAGRGPATGVAPVVSHMRFPEPWRVLVVLDPASRGLHGEAERAAFRDLPPLPDRDAADICRLVLVKALPAVAEREVCAFGEAVAEIQARLGDYFAPAQGGHRFTSPAVAGILEILGKEGAQGIGQSSWGPTGFAFAGSPEEADRLADAVRQHAHAANLDIRVCRGLNHGAEISTQADIAAPAYE